MTETTGLDITYIRVDSRDEAYAMLQNKELDAYGCISEGRELLAENHLEQAGVLLGIPLTLYGNRNKGTEAIDKLASAVDANRITGFDSDLDFQELLVYRTDEECLEALNSGDADAAVCRSYLAEFIISGNQELNQIEAYHTLQYETDAAIVVSENSEEELKGILSRFVPEISDREVNEYILKNPVITSFAFSSWIRDHLLLIEAAVTGIVLILFLIVLKMLMDSRKVQRLQKAQQELEKRIKKITEMHMAVCAGIYYLKPGEHDLKEALGKAGQAVDYLRDSSVSTAKCYDEDLDRAIHHQYEREELLENARVNRDFTVYYQQKVDIRTGEIVGAEALVRFLDPSCNGQVRAPGFFIPYYEKTGKVKEIDFFVFETVCKMLHRRIEAGQKIVPISCNFSRRHFSDEDFADHIEEIIRKYDIPKDYIEIEITETVIIEEMHRRMKETIRILQERGIHLSIDDFGAGYSSLGIFEQVPASVIKLDRSFLLNHVDYERQVKIMKKIVSLAADLNTQVVCEGVEEDKDVQLMNEIGAYVAQGYFYARPEPEKEFEKSLY